jgi:hypothetical protein
LNKTSKDPVDKFKPDNILRYYKYIEEVKYIKPTQLKFYDEKHLKGAKLFNKKARVDPESGYLDPDIVPSDF